VLHPKLDFSLLQNIKNKYDIEKYFIVANQFMGHKNHKVVLKAIAYLKSEGLLNSSFKVVMTGKKNDPRDGDVFNNFYKLAVELDVLNNIILTDVIDREDQLLLMHGAISLVQPSYFEGWNSSIEDAKAMNLNIICSSLDVHKEQLKNYYGIFFNPDDYIELAYILLEKFTSEKVLCDNPNYDYSLNQIDFQKELVKVFL
jgi:glycosyltransferase involved in cell wall biosynthesis